VHLAGELKLAEIGIGREERTKAASEVSFNTPARTPRHVQMRTAPLALVEHPSFERRIMDRPCRGSVNL
jgi:hypothetical protein